MLAEAPHVALVASGEDFPYIRLEGLPAISADGAMLVAHVASEKAGERMTRDVGIRWFHLTDGKPAEDTWIVSEEEDRSLWNASALQRSQLAAKAESRTVGINARLAATKWTSLRSAPLEQDPATQAVTAEFLAPLPVDSDDGIPKFARWATLHFKEPELTIRSARGAVLFQSKMNSWSNFAHSRSWVRAGGGGCAPVPVPSKVWFDEVHSIVVVKVVAGGLGPDGCGGDNMIDLVRVSVDKP